MLDDFFSDAWAPRRTLAYDPFKLELQDREKEYGIEAELPGVSEDQVNPQLRDGRLAITINREAKVEEESKNYIHRERRRSSIPRSLYLADAHPTGLQARREDGMLQLTVPKEEPQSKTSDIQVE